MPNLNDFINPDLTASDVVHSNGYASAATNGMGAGAGGMSLEQRRALASRQRTVGSYAFSHLGRRGNTAAKARSADQKSGRVYDANSGTFSERAKFSHRHQGGAPENKVDTSIAKRQRFIEPPARGHNPYA